MELETDFTPARLLAEDMASTSAADEAAPYNPASTTPHSLMNELPPRPPSPYKTMQHTAHRSSPGKSSVVSSFVRGRRNLHVVSAAVPYTSKPQLPATLSYSRNPQGKGRSELEQRSWQVCNSGANSLIYQSTQHGDCAVVYVDAETHDSAMQHDLVYEAPRQLLVEQEENERSALLANEEVVFTSVLISALQAQAEMLAGNDAEELVLAAARQRAEARREMLQVIEVEVAARLREQRLGEMLAVHFRALLPAHAVGYRRIEEEERDDLRGLFLWHKENRPLGPGCFIKGPEEDYRLRYVSRGTSAATATSLGSRSGVATANATGARSGLSSAMSSRDYAEQLRQGKSVLLTPKGALGEFALLPASSTEPTGRTPPSTQDGTYGPGEEAVYVEEGRLSLQAKKARRHAELRERRRYSDLLEAQADARQYVLAEEALCWVHLTCEAVDSQYAAVEAARRRKLTEAADAEALAERVAQRSALKAQVMRERGLLNDDAATLANASGEVQVDASAGVDAATVKEAFRPPVRTTGRRRSLPAHRNSESTVADSAAATETSLDPLPDVDDASRVEGQNRSASLAHLRLIVEGTESTTMCRQLTHAASSKAVSEVCEEL
jgi:hypothetical protein